MSKFVQLVTDDPEKENTNSIILFQQLQSDIRYKTGTLTIIKKLGQFTGGTLGEHFSSLYINSAS